MASSKSLRRQSRRHAFQILYGLNFADAISEGHLYELFEESPVGLLEGEWDEQARDFTWKLVLGVWKERSGLDEVIGRYSQHWKVNRIAKIELTILRLSVYEMLHCDDIPLKVAINEGVELSKEFGDGNSRNFVNGILDATAKAVTKGEYDVEKNI